MRTMRHSTLLVAILAANSGASQQPFDLDLSFRTSIHENYVNSMAILDNGDLLVSGKIRWTGDQFDRGYVRIDASGVRVVPFPDFAPGGGKLVAWQDRFYVGNGPGVRRIFPTGLIDGSFNMIGVPYFTPNQGGDYHVFPDGRVLLSGAHSLNYPQGGFTGTHHLVWFTNTGQLDTTRMHRKANAAIYKIHELADGRFLLSGVFSQYEGTPVGRILRIHPDGGWDSTFHTSIVWGQATGFHELPDGRVLAAGRFLFQNDPDTLHLVRLMPDGQLDLTFNNHLRSSTEQGGGLYPWVGIYPVAPDGHIVFGAFRSIDEQPRGAIALIDTAGNLLDDLFADGGCGTWNDQGLIKGSISGILPDGNGHYFIWGSYHGYDDGTTNDPLQRMVSRLHGLSVGVAPLSPGERPGVRAYPNPASTQLTVELEQVPLGAVLLLRDALGREVMREGISGHYHVLRLQGLGSGLYLLELWRDGKRLAAEKVVVQ